MQKVVRVLIFALALVAISSAVISPAIAQDVAREDTVILDLDRTIADPTNFNWFTPGTKRQHGAHQSMWEPLFILNYVTGEIEPWLGLSFTPNDSLDVWTLSLRDGVMWSDGEAFNADDVVFTINMLLGDETSVLTEAASMQQWVESVEKVDDLTVQFNLLAANPRFQLDYFSVRIFNSLLIMPEHVWAGQDPFTFSFYDEDQGWPIGTGPYKLTSTETNRTVWDRHDDWWGASSGFMELPEPLRLVWVSSGSEENRAQLLTNNQLDIGHNVTLGAFEVIQARNNNVISWQSDLPYAWPDPCPRQLDINTTIAPWDSPSMRQALNLIIDRNQIVAVAYEGTTSPSQTMFVQYGSMDAFISAVVDAGYGLSASADVEAAQAMIEAEGWALNNRGIYEKDGDLLTADVIVNNSSTEYTRTVDVVVEQLIRAGIDAVARPVDNSTFWGSAAPTGDYTIAYGWLSCSSVNEPWASMNRYTTRFVVPVGQESPGINNTGRWDTENAAAYTEIVDGMGTRELNDPEIPGLVAEAYSYIAADTPIIPLVQASKLIPMSTTYWTGWPTTENAYIHPAFWWNSAHRIIHNLTKSN